MDTHSRNSVLQVARRIIETEHAFFVDIRLDNAEHIPRIKRIALSVGDFLTSQGLSTDSSQEAVAALITSKNYRIKRD